jgi:hypothetical protein
MLERVGAARARANCAPLPTTSISSPSAQRINQKSIYSRHAAHEGKFFMSVIMVRKLELQ